MCSKHDKKAPALIQKREDRILFFRASICWLSAPASALENTELPPTLYAKINKEERRRRLADRLAMVGLTERAQHFPS